MMKNLQKKLIFNFARQKSIKLNQQFALRTKNVEEHPDELRVDPNDPKITEEFISQLHLDIQHLPEPLLRKAQSIFQRYPPDVVRDLGKQYMKLYQLLHATEKPVDLTKIVPFENTENLVKDNNSDDMIYIRSNKNTEEEMIEKVKQKRDQKQVDGKIIKQNPQTQVQDKTIEYTQNMAIAYLLRKFPSTFAVACRILVEVKYRLPEFKPKTFLDFGAGLGSGSQAFYDLNKDCQIFACEPSVPMRKLGKYISQDQNNIKWVSTLSQTLDPSQFDIVYCGYVLEELKSAAERELIIESLWEKVIPGGLLILVEPGSPKGFRFVHDFRNWIIKKDRSEANIFAPCPHHNECPLAKELSWCNFDQEVATYPKRIFPKMPTEKTHKPEKFSYLIAKKGEFIINDQTPSGKSFKWDRIIRRVMKRQKHKIIDVCSIDGKLERIIQAKSHGDEFGYKESKKLKIGDLWRFGRRLANKFRKEDKKGPRLW